jgi:hypothetical protein
MMHAPAPTQCDSSAFPRFGHQQDQYQQDQYQQTRNAHVKTRHAPRHNGRDPGNAVPLQDRIATGGTSGNPRTSNQYARVRNRNDKKVLKNQKELDEDLDGISREIAERVEKDRTGMEVDEEGLRNGWVDEPMGPVID